MSSDPAAETWSLFDPGLQDGAEAMALDDLALRRARPGSRPLLHLWRWAAPAISIGYAQTVEILDRARVRAAGLSIVRRPTGGKAVLHRGDICYSCVVPLPYRDFDRGLRPAYEFVANAIARALRAHDLECAPPTPALHPGPDRGCVSCAAEIYPYELVSGSTKILGSAQKRTKKAILVQGSIAPAGPADLAPFLASGAAATPPPVEAGSGSAAPEPVLSAAAIAAAFAREHAIVFEPLVWTPQERRAIVELVSRRYASVDYTARI